ncbi:MAG: hypothetical protein KAV87_32820, partial [Desulfobacteraceae bacterium]|nr:hypothetical protein [Desulfobacteraceae bacterium]
MSRRLSICTILILFVFFSALTLYAQWAKTYGGSDCEEACTPIQLTSDGGTIVGGHCYSGGSYNFWVLKTSSQGDVEWERVYGGNGDDYAFSLQKTSEGGYIIAGTTYSYGFGEGDAWIIKLTSDGSIEWQKTYGGSDDDTIRSLRQTNDGGYIAAGCTKNWGAGLQDIWVLKLSSTGSIEWQKTYGGSDDDYGSSIEQTSDGGYIVAAKTSSFGDLSEDAWILKLSSTGSIEWQQIYGGSGDDWASDIHQTNDGGYIVVGSTYSFGAGDCDGWILKLSSTGNTEWQRTYGGYDYDYTWSIRQTSDRGYIAAGHTYSFGFGQDDAWVFKLTSTGDVEWERTYGEADHDWARDARETAEGGYVVSGCMFSSGAGSGDFFIVKLSPDGNIHPSCGFIATSLSSVEDTPVSPVTTNIYPGNTSVSPVNSNCVPRSTGATVSLLCEEPKYDLTLNTTIGGTTDPPPGIHSHYSGKEITLTAVPDRGYRFKGWSGSVSETNNPVTVIMDSDKSLTAHFSRESTRNESGEGVSGSGDSLVQPFISSSSAERSVSGLGAATPVTLQVAAGSVHTVGLKPDGTVVAVGYNIDGQCNVSGWTGIVQVAAANYQTVGLKADGTVVAVGSNDAGQCNVSGWTGIVQVAAGHFHTVGLKANGTVVAVGDNSAGQCNVGGWTSIIQVAAGGGHTVGLKADGTVVAVGLNNFGQRNVSGWTGITQVTACSY